MTRPLFLISAAAAGLVLARPALAQHIQGTIGVQRLTFSLNDNGVAGQQTGTMLGGSLGLDLGVLRLGLAGQTGQLAGDSLTAFDLRMTTINAGLQATPWLEIGAQAVARREAVDTTIILQRLGGAYTRVTADLGGTFQGLLNVAFYPVNSVTGVDPVKTALSAGVGVRYAPNGGPVMVQMSYRIFRIDHQALTTTAPRLEQDQGLILELGLRH
ncbi:MAG TPA: hypothetical protein VGI92_13655 [Gemmatimonadales bacterium]|jgi:hypothetical protein